MTGTCPRLEFTGEFQGVATVSRALVGLRVGRRGGWAAASAVPRQARRCSARTPFGATPTARFIAAVLRPAPPGYELSCLADVGVGSVGVSSR